MARRSASTLRRFEDALGHRFDDVDLLEQALTHASRAEGDVADYQRLEFLGDRVLGLMTAEVLYRRFPDEEEGVLARRLNALVRKETCADVAIEIDLGAELRLARSEASTGGRRKIALLGDAMEAVIAAVYLDAGLEAARRVFDRHWGPRLDQDDDALVDAKTALQEWAQGRGLAPPSYRLTDRRGPDHAPLFTIEAALATGERGAGEGASKRAAEQAAAADLLARLTRADAPARETGA